MKTKHTPAPWNAAVDGWALNLVTHSLPTGRVGNICTMQCSGAKTQEEAKANALLISAAPDLLEACKFMYSLLQDMPEAEEELKFTLSAIKKAEGTM